MPAPAPTPTTASSSRSFGNISDIENISWNDFDNSPVKASNHPNRNGSFRQTTLWGNTLEQARPAQSQSLVQGHGRPYIADLPPEVPTHHELNPDALATWVYPLNLGPIRDYQFSIVKNGLFNNTLVALPTGLGKTFIAATIMLNFFRWTKSAKIIFVAPTKPLASQQVEACLSVAGIPRAQTTLLTGETVAKLRAEQWKTKRLFFMTPQTLMNDLSKGHADPKSIVLLVIDEAHRATGNYSYVKVVQFIRRFSKSFRVLALTATPGSSPDAVQDVITNLEVAHIEIRTEESLDLQPYVHSRGEDKVTFEPSGEMSKVRDLFSKALQPFVDKLCAQNLFYSKDPMSLTTYGLLQARKQWMSGPGRQLEGGAKFAIMNLFNFLQSIAHAIKLLNFHGIRPFYTAMVDFRDGDGNKGSGTSPRRQLLSDQGFLDMMKMIEGWLKLDGFTGHPKLDYLCQTLVNHFIDAGEGSATRAIVFSEYRNSAAEIVSLLNTQPLIKAKAFVGQADSKDSKGMKQKDQIDTVAKFKDGEFNVLVATSIGEEGLDIGQVDLIVMYDASASPIRMLQRMGRTGRKRAGNVVILLMKDKEYNKFEEARAKYSAMQRAITKGDDFVFCHDLSTRIIPRNIKPEVDKRHVEIPPENTQEPPIPKTSARTMRQPAPKKKFNMPDGVETGFIKASFFGKPQPVKKAAKVVPKLKTTEFDELPDLSKVFLSPRQMAELDTLYQDLPFQRYHVEDIIAPSLNAFPASQRVLGRTFLLKHGQRTKKMVALFKKLSSLQDPSKRFTKPYGDAVARLWEEHPVPSFAEDTDGEEDGRAGSTRKGARAVSDSGVAPKPKKRKSAPSGAGAARAEVYADEDEGDEATPTARGRGGRGRRAGKGRQRASDNLEDIGDDCLRTSDMDESDGSDDGADLEGFVVDDDMATSSMRQATSPTTPGSSKDRRGGARQSMAGPSPPPANEKPFYEPMKFTSGGTSDSDMPYIFKVTTKSASAKKAKRGATDMGGDNGDDDGGDDDDFGSRPSRRQSFHETASRGKRRRIVADSDDEDG
ncbi:hypothetical protein B0T25DRAFT_442179 [Lasiosphaeria hispida]|uniref:ATP-dependent DNA helicase n=1 Tax=Lasiosphaeria hispida TaxID=260671 RepID=A0AAJ0MJH0_9PEZI|nr:hypothetical protein B0T25DRAFT_442179 [Lasiosphaeria hispida]